MKKKVPMEGNKVIAKAAILAGCRHYSGYPITPQNEIPEYMSENLPKVGGVFIQAESELAAINMALGAAAAGKRAMTSSSSPGISLKQEGISYICCSELPVVIANVMRGGPGLGSIQPAQSDYFQATRGGGHGDYRTIVLAPSTVQEIADLVLLAFDLADKYRNPVMILADGILGQIIEPVEFKRISKKSFKKDWALTGAKDRPYNTIIPFDLDPLGMERINLRLQKKYQKIEKKEVRFEKFNMENPDIVAVAYGTVGRILKTVIREAKKEGIEIGLIRPITLWPFPYQVIEKAAKTTKKFIVVEMSLGQMVEDVKLAVGDKAEVHFYGRCGGVIPTPEEILDKVREIVTGKKQRKIKAIVSKIQETEKNLLYLLS